MLEELKLLEEGAIISIHKIPPDHYLSEPTFLVLISDHLHMASQKVTKQELLEMAKKIVDFVEPKEVNMEIYMDCPSCSTKWKFTIRPYENSDVTFKCHVCNGKIPLPPKVLLKDFKVVRIGGKSHGKNTV